MAIEIREEDDLYELIKQTENSRAVPSEEIRFIGWPRCEITIRGEHFDGGIPTRIMPALIELQKAVNHAFVRSAYDGKQRLSKEDIRKTELIFRVKPGSTVFVVDLVEILNHLIATSNMTGYQTLLAILGVPAIFSGTSIWKAYIDRAAKERELDYKTQKSKEETEKLRVLAKLAKELEQIRKTLEDMNKVQKKLLKSLSERDELFLDDELVVSGEVSKHLTRPNRNPRVHKRLDDDFLILSVDSGKIKDGFRVVVSSVKTGDEFTVDIPEGTLSPEQIDELKSGEWEKKPLRLQINTEQVGDLIVKATLTQAGLSASR